MSTKSRQETMRIMYDEAKLVLQETHPAEVDLGKYFDIQKTYKTKNDILYGLLHSLQNRSLFSTSINISREDRKTTFEKILLGYDSDKILKTYTEESLFQTFAQHFKINDLENPRGCWHRYTESIISACRFVNKFKDVADFDQFVMDFSRNKFTKAALPLLIEKEVKGLGFALACDFLKNLGYDEYPKPDRHIIEVFTNFNLCDKNQYSAYKAVIEMASTVGDTAFNVDRLFWLICSGNYFMDDIRVKRQKDAYIKKVKQILGE